MPIISGGGGGGGSFNGGTITGALVIDAAGGISVRDATDTDVYFQAQPGTGTVKIVASPATGDSALDLSTAAFTFKDELGNIMLDVEGGFASIGPAGELAIASNQIFATLPSSDPGQPGQLYQVAGTVHVSL